MKKRWAGLILLITVFLAAYAKSEFAPPPKPATVPAAALWVGGVDGGVFVHVSPLKEKGLFAAAIYFQDGSGLWYKGKLKHIGDAPFDPASAASYSAWDGDNLLLRNGDRLEAIGPH